MFVCDYMREVHVQCVLGCCQTRLCSGWTDDRAQARLGGAHQCRRRRAGNGSTLGAPGFSKRRSGSNRYVCLLPGGDGVHVSCSAVIVRSAEDNELGGSAESEGFLHWSDAAMDAARGIAGVLEGGGALGVVGRPRTDACYLEEYAIASAQLLRSQETSPNSKALLIARGPSKLM